VTLVAPEDVKLGEGVVVGSIFGVAAHKAVKDAPVDCHVVGIFEFTKDQAEAWTQGNLVYWDKVAKKVTTTAAGNMKIGAAISPGEDPSKVWQVRLNGAF
jgi:predicted RecA/RadA family phage recombinase